MLDVATTTISAQEINFQSSRRMRWAAMFSWLELLQRSVARLTYACRGMGLQSKILFLPITLSSFFILECNNLLPCKCNHSQIQSTDGKVRIASIVGWWLEMYVV